MNKKNILSKQFLETQKIVQKNFPAIWPLLHACLSAIASLCWKDFTLPIALILSGPSGSGKTEPLMWLLRSGINLFERCDAFTAASFVSHAANVKKKDLEKNDLLPKLKNRILTTKELAPVFSGSEDILKPRFAVFTSILDGEGFMSSSGTQGSRGYDEEINFVWLGATTPPPPKVYNLLAAMGTRMFFFSADGKRPTAKDYTNLIMGNATNVGDKKKCREAVKEFLNVFFENFPIRSISISEIQIPKSIAEKLGLLCEALTRLRGSVSLGEGLSEDEDRYGAPAMEHGWRAAQVLTALVKGSALIRGDDTVNQDDFLFVRQVVLSSMPEYRRLIFEALLTLFNGVSVTAIEVAKHTRMAKKTALHYLKELAILGIGEIDTTIEPFRFYLAEEFHDLVHTSTISVTPQEDDSKSTVTDFAPVCLQEGVVINDF